MDTIEVTYFGLKGRVATTRYILEDNSVPYTYVSVTFDEWPSVKESTPFGMLPTLTDGDLELAESGAMVRYLGRKLKLYGESEAEANLVDMTYEAYMDLFNTWVRMLYSGDKYETEKVSFLENLPYKLTKIQNHLEKNNKGKGFFVGKKISIADYGMFDILNNLNGYAPGCLDEFSTLTAFTARMASRDKLKAFLEDPEIKAMAVTGSGNF